MIWGIAFPTRLHMRPVSPSQDALDPRLPTECSAKTLIMKPEHKKTANSITMGQTSGIYDSSSVMTNPNQLREVLQELIVKCKPSEADSSRKHAYIILTPLNPTFI